MQENFKKERTVPHMIAEEIAKEIKASIYKAGDKLPSRKELAWQHEVHENTIKKVFGILRKQKLIKNKPHFGMVVLPIPRGMIKIAVIMPKDYFGLDDFIEGVKEICDHRRASVDVFAYKDSGEQAELVRSLQDGTCDGAIIHSKISDEIARNICALDSDVLSIVLLGTPDQPQFSCWRVDGNYYRAAYTSTERLLECNHRNIGIVISKSNDSIAFLEGYNWAMMGYERRVRKSFVQYVDEEKKPGESTARFISESRYSAARAIIYSDPEYALPGMEAIKEHGMKIGRDISVICFGDFPGSEYYNPPISVVRYNHMDVGRQAGDLLFQRMMEPDTYSSKSSKAGVELVIRETSIKTVKEQICLSELQRQRWAERHRNGSAPSGIYF